MATRRASSSKEGNNILSPLLQIMQRRYQSLQLRDAISRRDDYVEACKELQGFVRAVYRDAPKPFQALLYDDIIHAFRTLPGMETSRQLSAAKLLLLAVEDVFPKQRRAAAAHEYKISIIAWHRQYRNPEPVPECSQLSGDVLLHVFEFLDGRSLAMASTVCRLWNSAATDDTLWRTQFLSLFRTTNMNTNSMDVAAIHGRRDQGGNIEQVLQKQQIQAGRLWHKAFNDARKGYSSLLFLSNRAYCQVCKEVIWLTEPPWKPAKGACVAKKQLLDHHNPRPMTHIQVVRHVVGKDMASTKESSSSDSDDSGDDEAGRVSLRLWNVPKRRVSRTYIPEY